jgi:hypothetical protein
MAPVPPPGAAAAVVEVTATTNKHAKMGRIFMMHLQGCVNTKRVSILALVVGGDLIKIVSNAPVAR